MKLPGTEKLVPAFRHTLLTFAMLACVTHAHADAEEDYQKGREAYRSGDLVGSMDPLKKAADVGHAAAQALYGSILDDAELDSEAHKYLKMSADQNDPEGQYGLAKMYFSGEATPPNETETGRLMHAAAAQEHRIAIITLALGYLRGDARLGTADSNSPLAGQMLIKAAEFGDLQAIQALSQTYRKGGHGLAADPAKAEYWDGRMAAILGTQRKGGKK